MSKISLRAYDREINNLIENKYFDEVIAHCKYILLSYPKHIETYRLLGRVYLDVEKFNEASDIYQRILSAIPDDFSAQVGMGAVREAENNLDAAIWHIERAFEVQPSNPTIQNELRRLYQQRDNVTPPKMRLTRGALVRMYARGELYPQAITEARAVLNEEPQRIDIKLIQAQMHFQLKQNAEAVGLCSSIIQKAPYCFEANKILAELLSEFSKDDEAEIHRQRMHELDPYTAYINEQYSTSNLVPDGAVLLDKLIDTLELSEARTEESIEEVPDWMEEAGFSIGEEFIEDASFNKSEWIEPSPLEEINTSRLTTNTSSTDSESDPVETGFAWLESLSDKSISSDSFGVSPSKDTSPIESTESWYSQTIHDDGEVVLMEEPESLAKFHDADTLPRDQHVDKSIDDFENLVPETSSEDMGYLENISDEISRNPDKESVVLSDEFDEVITDSIEENTVEIAGEDEGEFDFAQELSPDDVDQLVYDTFDSSQEHIDRLLQESIAQSSSGPSIIADEYIEEQVEITGSDDGIIQDESLLQDKISSASIPVGAVGHEYVEEPITDEKQADELVSIPEDESFEEIESSIEIPEEVEEPVENIINDTSTEPHEKLADELISPPDDEAFEEIESSIEIPEIPEVPEEVEEPVENIIDDTSTEPDEKQTEEPIFMHEKDSSEEIVSFVDDGEKLSSSEMEDERPSDMRAIEEIDGISSFAKSETSIAPLSEDESTDDSDQMDMDDIEALLNSLNIKLPDTDDQEEIVEEVVDEEILKEAGTEDTNEEVEEEVVDIEEWLANAEKELSISSEIEDQQSDIDMLFKSNHISDSKEQEADEEEEEEVSLPISEDDFLASLRSLDRIEPDDGDKTADAGISSESLSGKQSSILDNLYDSIIDSSSEQSEISDDMVPDELEPLQNTLPEDREDLEKLPDIDLPINDRIDEGLPPVPSLDKEGNIVPDWFLKNIQSDEDTEIEGELPEWVLETDDQILESKSSFNPQEMIDNLLKPSDRETQPADEGIPAWIEESDISSVSDITGDMDEQVELPSIYDLTVEETGSEDQEIVLIDDAALPDWIKDSFEYSFTAYELNEEITEPASLSYLNESRSEWIPEIQAIQSNQLFSSSEDVSGFSENMTLPALDDIKNAQYTDVPSSITGNQHTQYSINSAREFLEKGNLMVALEHYNHLINSVGQIMTAIEDLENISKHHPFEAVVWQSLGDAYAKNNQLKKALDAYSKAEELLH